MVIVETFITKGKYKYIHTTSTKTEFTLAVHFLM